MPKFIVVKVEGRKETPVVDGHKDAVIFPTAKAAQYQADLLTNNLGIKHQLRPIQDENVNWRKREQDRFDSGQYTPVPWANAKWFLKSKVAKEHFLHVSKDDPSQIAFTESDKKGMQDKQVRMAPSKYLIKFFDKVIKERTRRQVLAAYKKKYGSSHDLKFAFTAEDIVKVFKDGPSSCMKGSKHVAAYAGPDLAVAYLEKKGKITARTVVWPKKKLYCDSVYGDSAMLREVLKDEGYKPSHRFQGARLTALWPGGKKPAKEVIKDKYYPYRYTVVQHPNLPSVEMASQGMDYGDKYVTIK